MIRMTPFGTLPRPCVESLISPRVSRKVKAAVRIVSMCSGQCAWIVPESASPSAAGHSACPTGVCLPPTGDRAHRMPAPPTLPGVPAHPCRPAGARGPARGAGVRPVRPRHALQLSRTKTTHCTLCRKTALETGGCGN